MLNKTFLTAGLVALLTGGLAASNPVFAADAESRTLLKNSYQQSGSNTSCAFGGCFIYFQPTISDTTLITAVSCSFQIASGDGITNASLGILNGSTAAFSLQPFIYGYPQGNINLGINSSTNLFLQKGEQPFIVVGVYIPSVNVITSPVQNLACTISGYQS